MIALSSELSRRAAEEAISRGEVTVNGEVVTVQGRVVDPSQDRICLRGAVLRVPSTPVSLVFFKPKDVLVTKSDPGKRPTIWDLLPEWKGRLNAIGRLDGATDGLLLLTNDGAFLQHMTHPRHEIWKTYHVRVKGEPGINELQAIRRGIRLRDGMTLPAKVKRIDEGGANALLELSLREGRNRQVRRMCEAIGTPVIKLRRVAIGPVTLRGLKPGEWRKLKEREVRMLRHEEGGRSRSSRHAKPIRGKRLLVRAVPRSG